MYCWRKIFFFWCNLIFCVANIVQITAKGHELLKHSLFFPFFSKRKINHFLSFTGCTDITDIRAKSKSTFKKAFDAWQCFTVCKTKHFGYKTLEVMCCI